MAAVVIDANIAVGLLVECPWSALAEKAMIAWKRQNVSLNAPAIWYGEVISALRKAVYLNKMDQEDALRLISVMDQWGVRVNLPDADMRCNALLWAERLGQMVAYDAQYLALAERLKADFYTADKKLFHRCQQIGASFVKMLE